MINNRGQIWSEYLMGVMAIVVCGLLYIILDQSYEGQFKTKMVELGVNAANATLIEYAWKIVPIPIVLAVLYSWINTSRRRMGYGYE